MAAAGRHAWRCDKRAHTLKMWRGMRNAKIHIAALRWNSFHWRPMALSDLLQAQRHEKGEMIFIERRLQQAVLL